jgi:excisionase family DNA binding protein
MSAMQRLVATRSLSMERLFTFVYLMERAVLDELALDAAIGATSQQWPLVGQIIRRASFDLMAAHCDRAQQDNAAPPISDKLTTLYSRALMDVVLSTEVQRAERFSFPLGFVVFDVDKLSEVNQRYGYGVGDRLLERLGILIRKFFRQHDWVFRHGEDSIAVLLCQVAADGRALSVNARCLDGGAAARVQGSRHGRAGDGDRERGVGDGAGFPGRAVRRRTAASRRRLHDETAKTLGGNRVETSVLSPGLLSVRDAARYLKCEPGVVQQLIAEGKLKATGTGATVTIAKLAIEDYRNAGAPDIKMQG